MSKAPKTTHAERMAVLNAANDAYNAISIARFAAKGLRFGVNHMPPSGPDAEWDAAFDAVVKAEHAVARGK